MQNIRVKAEFPDKYFHVIFASQNGTYYVVETLHKGFTTLNGELQTILLKVIEGNSSISWVQLCLQLR
jgi:hypothetical protein